MRIPSRALIAFLFVAVACLEPYAPPTMRDLRLLVVDGYLNSQTGLARVKLARSQPLDSELPYPAEFKLFTKFQDKLGEAHVPGSITPLEFTVYLTENSVNAVNILVTEAFYLLF